MNKKEFLGTGWSFPPQFVKEANHVVMTTDAEDIENSLRILMTTQLGERVMLPEYGCNLEELLFEKLNRTLITYITGLIRTAILYHEPRIDVLNINISEIDELEGKLYITIEYLIRATNSRTNFVFPFYKEEGSNI